MFVGMMITTDEEADSNIDTSCDILTPWQRPHDTTLDSPRYLFP